MKWQSKLGRFAGVDVNIHAMFLLIIAFVVWSHWAQGPARVLDVILFVLAIFACVVFAARPKRSAAWAACRLSPSNTSAVCRDPRSSAIRSVESV